MPVTNLLYISLAYKSVVAPLMVAEANFYAQRLGLPERLPIVVKEAKASVNSPLHGLGHLETGDFFYSFPGNDAKPLTNGCGSMWFREHGKLAYIMRKEPFRRYGEEIRDVYARLVSVPSLVDTNAAYRLAKDWLTKIEVDVEALERDHKPLAVQQEFYDSPLTPKETIEPPGSAPKKRLPIFDITWGGSKDCDPPVWVQILGTTKELVLLRMEDTRYSRHPAIVITNALELNGLPRPKFAISPNRPTLGDIFHISPAYSNAITTLMVNEASFFAEHLNLPLPRPLRIADVSAHISSPEFYRELGYVEAKGFEFHFPEPNDPPATNEYGNVRFIEPGKLAYVLKKKPLKEYRDEDGELGEKFFSLTPAIDERTAYELATQWLAAVHVDVMALEKEYKPLSVRAEYRTASGSRRKGPIFGVTWGGPGETEPPVQVQILGTTKELIALRMEDTRFSRRSPIVITNAVELNSQTAPETKTLQTAPKK
jgi:hypothetical protein